MKRSLLLVSILSVPFALAAQWSGTNPIYYNGGNVGIGTSTPQGVLHVNTVRPIILKNNGGNGVYGSEIGFNAMLNTSVVPNQFKKLGGSGQHGGAAMITDYTGNILFQMYNASTEMESIISYNPQITFTNTGRVGIGRMDPQTLLNIGLGAGDPVTGTAALRIGGTSNYPSLELGIKGSYDGMISTYGNDLHLYAGNWRVAGATATENHNISFYTSQSSSTNWNTAKMFLRYDGNLGVGTTTPSSKVHVSNPTSFNANESAAGQDHILFDSNSPGVNGYFGGLTWQSGGRRRASIVATQELADEDYIGLAFFTRGTDGPGPMYESMRIARSGNVGIGTTTPDQKLTVDGTVRCEEVKVELVAGTGPDYVFEDGYDLLPLAELKNYISQNKHLPEVPSAKEMESEGLNLKEMNLLLLKKVEELTLHLIEQERKINSLENEVRKKKSR
jgi:hypothetical protein